ncbi:MAG: type 4a pilus biogenesis protein PilO [Candidatus Omnitrophota bacterium]
MKRLVNWNWKAFWKGIERRDLYLLGGVSLTLFFLFLYGFWFRPNLRKVQEFRRELYALQVQISDVEALGEVSQVKREAETLLHREKIFRGRLFKRNEIPRTLEQLRNTAEKHRLDLLALKPELRPDLAPYDLTPALALDTLPVRLQVTGHYTNMGQFLGSLRNFPYLMSVEEVRMESLRAIYPKVEMRLVIMFYLEQEEKEARAD